MHPPLHLHKHDDCQQEIINLAECHKSFTKFIGACNRANNLLDQCLYKEYRKTRAANKKQADERKLLVKENEDKFRSEFEAERIRLDAEKNPNMDSEVKR